MDQEIRWEGSGGGSSRGYGSPEGFVLILYKHIGSAGQSTVPTLAR